MTVAAACAATGYNALAEPNAACAAPIFADFISTTATPGSLTHWLFSKMLKWLKNHNSCIESLDVVC